MQIIPVIPLYPMISQFQSTELGIASNYHWIDQKTKLNQIFAMDYSMMTLLKYLFSYFITVINRIISLVVETKLGLFSRNDK